MKTIIPLTLVPLVAIALSGCYMPQVVQPLHLYDLKDGSTIEVFIYPKAREYGVIASASNSSDQFTGEYSFAPERASNWPPGGNPSLSSAKGLNDVPADFAEAYGFGKNSSAKPVGTGILVGKNGKVIEVVFFRIGYDMKNADGVGRDNNGRFYRVFLSTETQAE